MGCNLVGAALSVQLLSLAALAPSKGNQQCTAALSDSVQFARHIQF